jgi:hypothetical protein
MYKNIKVEAEHNELILENSHGDTVIVPANKRSWVKQKLSEGCHDCIDSLVETLPVASQYAQDGSWFPSWMNPKNWGVTDYSDRKDFNTAYSDSKKKGEKEFLYKDKRYNTNYAGTPRQEVGRYGIDGKPVHSMDVNHPAQVNLYPMFGKYLPGHISASIGNNETSIDYSSIGNYPFGIPKVKPKGEKSFNVYGQDNLTFSNKAASLPTGDYMLEDEYNPSDWSLFTNNCADNVCDAFGIPRSKGVQTPSGAMSKIKKTYPTLDVTGRTYEDYKELADKLITETHISTFAGGNKKEYTLNKKPDEILRQSKNLVGLISSPELQKTRVSKNITIAIQNSLSEKGYSLSKSTKKDGSFDGIFGEETKAALLDYQTKNKSK